VTLKSGIERVIGTMTLAALVPAGEEVFAGLPEQPSAVRLAVEARPQDTEQAAGAKDAGDLGHGHLVIEPVPGR
jgi:hypothetical protein